MTLHRFLAEPGDWDGNQVRLTGDEAHHLRDVLRLRAGQPVEVFDGRGLRAEARVRQTSRHEVILDLGERRQMPPWPVRLTLFQALPKGQKLDLVIQKAVELGAARIVPLETERVVREGARRDGDARRARWQRIAVSAAKQCGTAWIPEIGPVLDWTGALAEGRTLDTLLIGSLEADARPLHDVLRELRAAHPGQVGILIGPEGDFSPAELLAAREAGARPVSFGPRVLRTETAALYALSVLAYELFAD